MAIMFKHLTTKTVIAAGAATLAISAVTAPAEAATVTPFTNRTAWENALTSLGLSATSPEPFGTAIPNASSITFGNGVISQGFDGTSTNRVNFGSYEGGLETPSSPGGSFDRIEWTFPSTRGFGADWRNTSALLVEIDGQTFNFSNYVPINGGFLGFISDNSFTTATFTANSNLFFDADNLSYAPFNDPAVVPTPALLPGLIGMGIAAWRKRKAEAAESEV